MTEEEESLFEDGSVDDELELGEEDADETNSTSTIKVAREDIKLMNVVRAIVILVLMTFAFVSAEIVYVVALVAQQNSFESAYSNAATRLINAFYQNIEGKVTVAQSLADQFSSSAEGSHWPFVTFSDFQTRCSASLQLSKASSVTVSPLLESSLRGEWEKYATTMYINANSGTPATVSGEAQGGVTFFPTGRKANLGVYNFQSTTTYTAPVSSNIMFPIWQTAPQASDGQHTSDSENVVGTLFNLMSNSARAYGIVQMVLRDGSAISKFLFNDTYETDLAEYSDPRSVISYPIYEKNATTKLTVGAVNLEFKWEAVLSDAMQSLNVPLLASVENSCGENFTFADVGGNVTSLNGTDIDVDISVSGYKPMYSSYQTFQTIFVGNSSTSQETTVQCNYRVGVFALEEFQQSYINKMPEVYRFSVLVALLFTVCVFLFYDALVGKQQDKVVKVAQRSDAIVRSLFPLAVRDRLYDEAIKKEQQRDDWKNTNANSYKLMEGPKSKLKRFASADDNQEHMDNLQPSGFDVEPIADLFSSTTIFFADITGFTAWSSEREPSQVFTLLEAIYGSMDKVAKRLGVFKVETVGDCYVAATGIPEPQPNHAQIMARFARISLHRVNNLTKKLEAQLGPGTADLSFRVGLHSGPVTAGVLRGQKARFQLFGDTMNMAARMESGGVKNRIHISEDTAKLLIEAGLQHWVVPRSDLIDVKGKGECQTYWLLSGSSSTSSTASLNHSDDMNQSTNEDILDSSCKSFNNMDVLKGIWHGTSLEDVLGVTNIDEKVDRLIDWNADMLSSLLKHIIAADRARGQSTPQINPSTEKVRSKSGLVMDEVQMIIRLPEYDAEVAAKAEAEEVELPAVVRKELRDYVSSIATGYRTNAFHNFEHASHVCLSATKLLKRVLRPEDLTSKEVNTTEDLHNFTYGIATDPITQFAVVFSALIHDVGHKGCPNFRLAVEEPEMATKYKNKSIAEQRSIDIAWELLMLPHFANLRSCIYRTRTEFNRFRALVVNSVIATDIFDKDMKERRNLRWNLAFHDVETSLTKEAEDRKATIVIEHIIQASDVAHTMQHWHIYLKWNERLFQEMYKAYLQNRSDKDPCDGWYEGEIWFFDNYVIPLAKKLRECQVFGVSSDEYFIYAEQNRNEWERKGQAIVEEMKRNFIKGAKKMGLKRLDAVEEEDELNAEMSFKTIDVVSEILEDYGGSIGNNDKTSIFSSASAFREVVVPPGALGITVNLSHSGPFVVEIQETSPLRDLIAVGDLIRTIDGFCIEFMDSTEIEALINKDFATERVLTVGRV